MSKPKTPGAVRRRLEIWRSQYRPKIGFLWPKSSVTLTLRPPFAVNEIPVLVQPNPSDIVIQKVEESTVTLVNTTHRPCVYLIAIVPSRYAKLAMIPWAQVAMHVPQLAKTVKFQDVLQLLGQFFTKKVMEV